MKLFECVKNKKFLLFNIFFTLYIAINLIGGERGLISYFDKKNTYEELIEKDKKLTAELKDLDSELENRNIVSKDNAEAIEAPLPEGTETATREGNPLFATFLENSTGFISKLIVTF